MTKLSLIYITCKNSIEAKGIANTLIQEKLIACANIIKNMESIYEYEGKIHIESEVILILKTKHIFFDKIKIRAKELHSYTAPCILEIPINDLNNEFANWVNSVLK